jgi:hypothetical protein
MKPLTRKKAPAPAKTVKPEAKAARQTPRRAEAQCCAKTSHTVAGCHD